MSKLTRVTREEVESIKDGLEAFIRRLKNVYNEKGVYYVGDRKYYIGEVIERLELAVEDLKNNVLEIEED